MEFGETRSREREQNGGETKKREEDAVLRIEGRIKKQEGVGVV
jgi:hypothetical protein